MSERLALASPREQPFQPPTSSNLMPLLLGLGISALFCLAVWQDWLTFGDNAPGHAGHVKAVQAQYPPARTPETGPAPAAAPHPEARSKEITKCTAKAAAVAYVDGPCPIGTQPVIVAVQPDMNLADGLDPGERMASIRENREVAQAVAAYERQVAARISAATPAGPAECNQLEALIKWVDEAARRPNVAAELDRLAGERRKLRDRQFALRCQ